MSEKQPRELDAWIAEHVTHEPTGFVWPQEYTTDPAAAMRVLEECGVECYKNNKHVSVRWYVGGWSVAARDSYEREHADAKTLPLAICLFAKELFAKEGK